MKGAGLNGSTNLEFEKGMSNWLNSGLTHYPTMNSELRSGRLIGFLFAIPCSIVTLVCLEQDARNSGFWIPSMIFGLGAFVGLYLLINPRTLVRVNDGMLELYPGSLGSNRKQIAIPLEKIVGFEVRIASDGDGSIWLLSLYLQEPQNISEKAQGWIRASIPKRFIDQAQETTILWNLSWPAGGSRGARKKINNLIESRDQESARR